MSLIWGRVDLATANRFKTILQMQVYTVLSSFQGGKGTCNPSLQAISDRMTENGIVSRTGEPYKIRRISQVIGELRALGLVETHRVGLGRSNTYTVGVADKRESAETANQSRVHRGESRVASQARESYRKEHLKRTPEKNVQIQPQSSLIEKDWSSMSQADIVKSGGEWGRHRKREAEIERRMERERYSISCEEATDLLLPGLRKIMGVAS